MANQPGPVAGFPSPGERIGPYEIVRQLGTGGMGVVFEAVDTVLRRRVALKVITPHLAGDPAFRVRFTQEAQAQASLDSPHVVQVFAHGEADGALYIASQLIPGGDLGAIIRSSGAPPPYIALDLVAQVATGLGDAHAMGLVRRVQRDVPAPAAVRNGTDLEQPVATALPVRSRTPTVVAVVAVAAVAVLLLVGGAVGLVAALDGDDKAGEGGGAGGAGSGDDATSATTDEHRLTVDEQRAADNIAAALVEDGDFEGPDATCTARRLVQQSGIDSLQEKGVVDEDLAFVADSGDGVDPTALADIITVSVACVFDTVTFGGSPSTG